MYQTGEAYLEDGTEIISIIGDSEKEEALEAEYWTYRLAKQAALDILSYGHIGTGNMDAISMMGADQQIDTLQLAVAYSSQIDASLTEMSGDALSRLDRRKDLIAFNSVAKKAIGSSGEAEIVEMD